MHISKFVIFAGGKGTRLSELTISVPKPAVEINDKPLITYLFDWGFDNGLDEIIVAAGYKHDVLKRKVVDYYTLQKEVVIDHQGVTKSSPKIPLNAKISIVDTGRESDTAERLFLLKDKLVGEQFFLLTYGDTLTNLDFSRLLLTAKKNNKLITMSVGQPDSRYGEIEIEDNLLIGFQEKKRPQFLVNRGFFLIKPEIFNDWKSNFISFEKDVLPYFVEKKEVAVHQETCWFHSVDSIKDLSLLEEQLGK